MKNTYRWQRPGRLVPSLAFIDWRSNETILASPCWTSTFSARLSLGWATPRGTYQQCLLATEWRLWLLATPYGFNFLPLPLKPFSYANGHFQSLEFLLVVLWIVIYLHRHSYALICLSTRVPAPKCEQVWDWKMPTHQKTFDSLLLWSYIYFNLSCCCCQLTLS